MSTQTTRKGKPLPQLERFYHTLSDSIPLDRCLSAAGYRSVRQFCKANDVSDSLLGCWRRGKLYNERDMKYYRPTATVVDEMTNFKNGISTPLYRLMEGTGFLEYELFPEVFNDDFYDGVYRRAAIEGRCPTQTFPNIEQRELARVVKKVLHTLPDRHRLIIELAFGLNEDGYGSETTYDAIGRKFGLTRERVRQIILKALRELRRPSRLRPLLDACWWMHDDKIDNKEIPRYGKRKYQ